MILINICVYQRRSVSRLLISLHAGLRSSVGIRLLYSTIGVLSEPGTVREQNVLLAARVLDCLDAVALNSLDSAIGEDGLFLAVRKDALDRAIRENDLLGSVRKVLLNLTVAELEHLQAISIRSLRCPRLGEVVNNFAVWVRLLDVIVVEVDNGVAIPERFSANAIAENYLLLSVGISALHLTIVAHNALDCLRVRLLVVVVLIEELHLVVFLFVLGLVAILCHMLLVASQVHCTLFSQLNLVALLLIQSFLAVGIGDFVLIAGRHLLAYLFLCLLELFHARLHVVVLVSALTRVQALGAAAATLALLSATS